MAHNKTKYLRFSFYLRFRLDLQTRTSSSDHLDQGPRVFEGGLCGSSVTRPRRLVLCHVLLSQWGSSAGQFCRNILELLLFPQEPLRL